MNKGVYIFVGVFLFLLSACSSSVSEDSIKEVSIEIPFELQVGETASIEDHLFTFTEVRSDSRCPSDALCIWAGEATIVLTPQNEGDLIFKEVTLSTNSTDAYTYLFPENTNNSLCSQEEVCTISSNPYTYGYLIQLNSLSPLPKAGEEVNPEEYSATLTIYLSL